MQSCDKNYKAKYHISQTLFKNYNQAASEQRMQLEFAKLEDNAFHKTGYKSTHRYRSEARKLWVCPVKHVTG